MSALATEVYESPTGGNVAVGTQAPPSSLDPPLGVSYPAPQFPMDAVTTTNLVASLRCILLQLFRSEVSKSRCHWDGSFWRARAESIP